MWDVERYGGKAASTKDVSMPKACASLRFPIGVMKNARAGSQGEEGVLQPGRVATLDVFEAQETKCQQGLA